jgi:hypothetical protein
MVAKGNVHICPNCDSLMKKGEAPFRFQGSYLGHFEAYKCSYCKRNYFTEKAYEEIMEIPVGESEKYVFSADAQMPILRTYSTFQVIMKLKSRNVSTPINKFPLEIFDLPIPEATEKSFNTKTENLALS